MTRALVPTSAAGPADDTLFWWLVRLRWLALAGVAAVLLVAGPLLARLPEGSQPWLWAVTLTLAAYNAALARLGPGRSGAGLGRLGAQIAVDCAALAGLVHFAGGIDNPFLPLFVLHVINADVVLPGRTARWVLGLAIALIVGVGVGEASGVLTHQCLSGLGAGCPGARLGLDLFATLGGLVLTLVMTSSVTRFLTEQLRERQRRLQATVGDLEVERDLLVSARAETDAERGRLTALIDCMSDAVSFVDPQGRELFSNQRARELWPDGGPAATDDSFRALLRATAEGAGTAGAGATIEHGDRTLEVTCSSVWSPQGEVLGLVAVARDVSERLAIERRLLREEQMSVVGRLAAAVAHEVNNPIGVISLYSQHALAHLTPGDPVMEHLEVIRRNAEGCRRIVGGLLKLSRPHAPERRRTDLRQLCREVVESVRPLAARSGAEVSEDAASGSGPVWASVDPGLIHQAVLNLAVNAIEAVERGGEVSIGVQEATAAGRTTHVIEVRDDGPGIEPELLERIFHPFFTTKAEGTGLGLAVAEGVVRSHHGQLEVESEVGGGTRFRLVLPSDGPARPSGRVDAGPDVEDEA